MPTSPKTARPSFRRAAPLRATKLCIMALKLIPSRIKTRPSSRVRMLPTEGGKNAAHYQSEPHRAWRAAVLRRDGYRCVKCGAGGEGVRLIADHIVELEDGGAALDVDNGQTLCAACSNRKTSAARRTRLS
jgi:5-methylcytosine-specific restriction protein A